MDLVAGVHSLSEGSVANKLNLRNHIGVTVPSQLLVLIVGLNSSAPPPARPEHRRAYHGRTPLRRPAPSTSAPTTAKRMIASLRT